MGCTRKLPWLSGRFDLFCGTEKNAVLFEGGGLDDGRRTRHYGRSVHKPEKEEVMVAYLVEIIVVLRAEGVDHVDQLIRECSAHVFEAVQDALLSR
jgi:hypothetical protein